MRRALLLVLLLLLAAAACSGRDTKGHSAGSANVPAAGSASGSASGGSASGGSASSGNASGGSASAMPADAGSAAPAETFGSTTATVTLEKSGAEPRRAVAYAPHAAGRTAKLAFSTGMDDTPKGMAMGIIVTFAWKTPADAAHPYELVVQESKAQPPADAKGGEAQMMGAIGGMYSAITVRVDADARGRARLVRTSGTLPTNPSLLWLLYPMIVPLPAEPFGVGARWQVKQSLEMNNLAGEMTRTYEVTAMKLDTITVKVSGATHWRDQTGSADDTLDEGLDGTLVIGTADILAVSANVTSTQDLGIAKAKVHLRLGP